MTAEEGRCGVAVALTGSRGVETHVSSAAMGHATDHWQQDEVSAKTWRNIQTIRINMLTLFTFTPCHTPCNFSDIFKLIIIQNKFQTL